MRGLLSNFRLETTARASPPSIMTEYLAYSRHSRRATKSKAPELDCPWCRRSSMQRAEESGWNPSWVEVDGMIVRRAFERKNVSNPLFVAGNGLEGLAMLRGDKIPKERRLVLLDLNMPKMNGIEFLQALRADPELASTPVVVLTTSNDDQDKIDAYNLNVAGYLLKPVTFSNFCERMTALNKYWTLAVSYTHRRCRRIER